VTFFLDTNTCIYALKGTFPSIAVKLKATGPSAIQIPSMVEAELLLGAAKSKRPADTRKVIAAFLAPFEIAPFGTEAAHVYAEIRGALEHAGKPIGPNDFVIAATTIARAGTLVTANVAEFKRVPRLKYENWAE
jgi:tRNA(fMet)-specific endonuclease VapC